MKTLGHKDNFLLVICGSGTINLGPAFNFNWPAFNFNLLELGKNKIQLTILLLVLGKNKTVFKHVLWCYCLNLELLSVIALTYIPFSILCPAGPLEIPTWKGNARICLYSDSSWNTHSVLRPHFLSLPFWNRSSNLYKKPEQNPLSQYSKCQSLAPIVGIMMCVENIP